MSSKRRLRRHQCGRKEPLTRLEAIRVAAKLQQRTGQRINAYKCPWGPKGKRGHWHVGHTPRKVRQAVAARAQRKG